MRKSFALAAALTAVTAFALAPTQAQAQLAGLKAAGDVAGKSTLVQKTKRRRGRVAAGIALGILGAAAAAHAYNNDHYRDDRYSRHERRCWRWRRWCRNGDDDACWRYDNRC